MGMKDVTHGDVLKAIAEFDDLGREDFLKKYKRGKSTGYFLEHKGREYDSKAILGAAHEHAGLGKLEKFSGGEDATVKYLRRLNFRVVKSVVNWTPDEMILACDFAKRHDWKWMPAEGPEVQELSELLRMLPIFAVEDRPLDFRSPGSVEAKVQNINTVRKNYGKKKTNGSRLDEVVLKEFLDHPDEMAAAAEAIRSGILSGELQKEYEAVPDIDDSDEDEGTPEGRLLKRKHLYRERDRKKREQKIEQHKKANNGKVACETCGFDFAEAYGSHGQDYIECHHVVPLSSSGETTTYLKDLILVCSNCHRMIHRKSTWLTPDQLRDRLKK
jgi:5-methylcytosine-specific restriction protein A